MLKKNKSRNLFCLILIICFLGINLYLNNINLDNNKVVFENYQENELIYDGCGHKYRQIEKNKEYEVRYIELDFSKNIGNLKCINSITKIDFKNQIIFVARSVFTLKLLYYFLFLSIFFIKRIRFLGFVTLYILKIVFDIYNYGYSDYGYPDLITLIILYYAYEK